MIRLHGDTLAFLDEWAVATNEPRVEVLQNIVRLAVVRMQAMIGHTLAMAEAGSTKEEIARYMLAVHTLPDAPAHLPTAHEQIAPISQRAV
jgi:hypothetical protein